MFWENPNHTSCNREGSKTLAADWANAPDSISVQRGRGGTFYIVSIIFNNASLLCVCIDTSSFRCFSWFLDLSILLCLSNDILCDGLCLCLDSFCLFCVLCSFCSGSLLILSLHRSFICTSHLWIYMGATFDFHSRKYAYIIGEYIFSIHEVKRIKSWLFYFFRYIEKYPLNRGQGVNKRRESLCR